MTERLQPLPTHFDELLMGLVFRVLPAQILLLCQLLPSGGRLNAMLGLGGYFYVKRKQQGFTFLEMLIAFGVLATAIVGVVAMQGVAKKGSFDAVQRALATTLANDIVQRMRVNIAGVSGGSYTGTYTSFTSSSSINRCQNTATPCTSTQIAANDLYEWKMALFGADVTQNGGNAGGLSSPVACISHANGVVSVVVAWQGRAETSDSAETKASGTLAASCGSASNRRRQVYIDTFVF